MKEITVQEKYELYCDTLSHCGTFLLDSSDDEIGYHIFEEFDTDSISFLHPKTLDVLLNAKYITQEIYALSVNLAKSFRALEDTDLWNVSAVRTSKEWHTVLSLADKIKGKLTACGE
ncbi:MAG: hypothetical protein K2I75_02520 [Clostridiales bacterium]|nr:hypothetical protein [Clostridiales bacterium]